MELEIPKIGKKAKIKLIIILSLLGILLIFHLIWYINFSSYKKYTQTNMFIKDDYRSSHYADYENEYTYSVFAPNYPQFTGNLAITPHMTENRSEGETIVSLVIWPNAFVGYEVGVTVSAITVSRYIESIESWQVEAEPQCHILLDENMQPTDENAEESLKAYDEYTEDIKRAYKMAYDIWGILEIE